jgi:fumarate reductase subunit D
MNVRLYVWQRLTAALMVPLVLVHVAVIFYATRQGMTAADIHARQYRVGFAIWHLRRRRGRSCLDRRPQRLDRMVAAERSERRHIRHSFRNFAAAPRAACGRCGGVVMTARRLSHRKSVLWMAALVHRLSGLALAIFLPLHFLTLGLAIHGEARLEGFLRWSDQPLVKLAESGLVFLLMVHMLGGLRLLVIENLDWRDGQKQLATIAAGISAVVALILLARMF